MRFKGPKDAAFAHFDVDAKTGEHVGGEVHRFKSEGHYASGQFFHVPGAFVKRAGTGGREPIPHAGGAALTVHAEKTDAGWVHAHDVPSAGIKKGDPVHALNEAEKALGDRRDARAKAVGDKPSAKEWAAKVPEGPKKSGAELAAAAHEASRTAATGAEHEHAEKTFRAAAKAFREEGDKKQASKMTDRANGHREVGGFRREVERKRADEAKAGSDEFNRDDQGRFAPK